jgi:hypothetical protein
MPFTEKGKSRLKMVALMPPNEKNITWYSPIDQNNKPNDFIITGMFKRFSKQEAAKRTQVYQFWEGQVLVYELKTKIQIDTFSNWIKLLNQTK